MGLAGLNDGSLIQEGRLGEKKGFCTTVQELSQMMFFPKAGIDDSVAIIVPNTMEETASLRG